MRKTLLSTLLASALLMAPGLVAAQTAPMVKTLAPDQPNSFLFIGNSFYYFNNGITRHIAGLERGLGGPVHRATMATIGGSGLDWHDVESYFRPGAVGSYEFDAKNDIVFAPPGKTYDAAVMMDCSQCPIHPQLAPVFVKYAKLDADIVRRHGAIPILFMSWAYADKPEMTAPLAEAYTKAGNDNGALVIPAGIAFARALRGRPDVKLYIADNRHPTLAGTYLAAATTYAAIQGRSPEASTYTAGLDADLASYLRSVAWATVQAYFNGSATN
jgi:hypothetical protein